MFIFVLAAATAALRPQIALPDDCSSISIKTTRLACYDQKSKTVKIKQAFGSVAGRLTSVSASPTSYRRTSRIILIPFPPLQDVRSKLAEEARSTIGLEYTSSPGAMSTGTDGPGEFRLSHVPVGKYLAVMYSSAFSMRASTSGCALISDGIFEAKTDADYMVKCRMVTVFDSEEASIFENFVGARY
jgi:hypothetical protein